jgi:hypothetical protein
MKQSGDGRMRDAFDSASFGMSEVVSEARDRKDWEQGNEELAAENFGAFLDGHGRKRYAVAARSLLMVL